MRNVIWKFLGVLGSIASIIALWLTLWQVYGRAYTTPVYTVPKVQTVPRIKVKPVPKIDETPVPEEPIPGEIYTPHKPHIRPFGN